MNNPMMENPQELLMQLCRHDFTAFLRKAWPWISGGDMLAWNWHLDAIAEHLERIGDGDLKRSLINLPPRNGKSKTVSVIWVAWMLGRDPTLNFVCVSYSNELSGKFARDCRTVMEAPWYQEIFPGTIVSQTRSASHDFETTRGGGRLATSVGGSLTGRGGDIIILDDVIKPEEANSETTRNAVNEWFKSTLASRLDDKQKGVMVCVMQRLHEHDLSGMLLEQGGWDHLSLPAIATEEQSVMLARGGVYRRREGEVLHPEREPLDILLELKASMGSSAFEAQYQQQPLPAEGNLFKADWLTYFELNPHERPHGEVIQSWDTAIKIGSNNDFSVCITAVLQGKYVHLIDVWRGKLEFPELERKAIELARLHRAGTIIIEDKASGQQLLQALRAGSHSGVPKPIGRNPEQDKYSRAAGISSIVESGQLLIPREANWFDEFRRELLAFPSSRHDDQVDALAQLLDYVRSCWMYRPSQLAGPTLFTFHNDGSIERCGEDELIDIDFSTHSDDPWGL